MPQSLAPQLDAFQFPASGQISDEEFAAIRALIYREAGISLGESKRALVCSRLSRRLRALDLHSHGEYLDYLANRDADGRERQEMINCLTTNKTDFFREPHHFAFLREVVFPQIERRAACSGPRRLRIWSAACSMGDEPYSIAMEALDYPAFKRGWDIRILASDISTRALETAQSGRYPMEQIAPVSAEMQRKYFLRGTGRSQGLCEVRPEVKRLITFRQINLMDSAWPIRSQFDVIFCRNVIIYFDLPTQQRVLPRLAQQIDGGGYLMLGHSESPQWLTDVLSPLGQTIYQRPGKAAGPAPHLPPTKPPVRTSPPQCKGAGTHCPVMPADCPSFHDACPRMLAACPDFGQQCLQQNSMCPKRAVACGMVAARRPRREIIAGNLLAAPSPTEIVTTLGSCVAACLFDPQTRIGGMNHFMLPSQASDQAVSARYGVHAMELLINGIMKLGGDRRRLRAKVFGGANVLRFEDSVLNVGQQNCRFVRHFLQTERIPIVAQRLGGKAPLRVHFISDTAQAFVKEIISTATLAHSEENYSRQAAARMARPPKDNVTLF